jgi:[acyl-carrier-protein] S-malonyltransferase
MTLMTLAVLCSGQGPQHRRMFALTGDAPRAAELFAHAATLLGGRDPRVSVQTDTDDELHQNRAGQILCTLQSLAAAATLRDAWGGRLVIAGYSVGELAAWGVAGLFGAAVTLDLAAHRAEAMNASSPNGDGLLFVRGLSRTTLDALGERHGVMVAIVNGAAAYVMGGAGAALDALAEEALRKGARRAIRLAVNVASHTNRLAAASLAFRESLDRAPVRHSPVSGTRVLSGIDGSAVIDTAIGMDKLARQISHTIQWADCLASCVEAGASAFLELGPGRALSNMAALAYPQIPSRSLEEFRTLQGVRDWLARVA